MAAHTNAPLASRALRAWRPLPGLEEARRALAEVAEGLDLVAREARLPAPYVEDHGPALRILEVEGAMLEGPDLVSAARTLEGVRKLAAFLRRESARWPRLAERFRRAPALPDLERRLLDAFDAEARLVDHASVDLARLRAEVRRHRAALVESLSRLIASLPHTLVAADSRPTLREGRYVVPLRREALSEVAGIVHDESASGATIFIEPHDAIQRNNALRHAELAVRREEERILKELTAALAERRVELEHAARLALHAETVLARARYALAVQGHPPVLGGRALRLFGARHPLLLERVAEREAPGDVVPLDLELDDGERALVVTGPNTGGKTVLLKTVGVTVLMAQSGIVPPVGPRTELAWHDALIADIGDTQSIAEDLSTFTAHLTRLKAATEAAAPAALILVDEIGASTDPAEGAALAAGLLETWLDRGARSIVTTHYHALKALAGSMPGIVNGSLAYDVERNLPRYRFVKGVPGRSFGLELARRWDLGEEVLARAHARLDTGLRDLDELTRRLAAEELALVEARLGLEAERRAIGDAESARARRIAEEAAARREAAEQRLAALESQLDRLRDEVRTLQRKLRERGAALAEAEARARSAQALAEEAAAAQRSERETLRAEVPAPQVAVGDLVRIPRYQVEGELVEMDRAGDACAVSVGQVRIACRVSELELVTRAAERSPGELAATAAGIAFEPSDLPLEIDLRGMTADEVAFPVAGAIERGYHTGRGTIRFIHGKGTGVLRARVRELLEKHPYVSEFRLGYWDEGGDGVTIATLVPHEEERRA